MDEFFSPFFNDLTQQAIRVIPGPIPSLDLVGKCILDDQYRLNDKVAQTNVIDRGNITTNKKVTPNEVHQPVISLEVPKSDISIP